MSVRKLVASLSLMALVGCSEPKSSPTPTATTPTATPTAHTPVQIVSGNLLWDAPADWSKVDHPSPMRKATYKIPRAGDDTEDGEMTVTQVGGDLESNISRWSGQFSEKPTPARNEISQAGLKITVVEMSGTYQGMAMPGSPQTGPKTGYALLAAIVEGEGLGTPYFFKLVGPDKTVAAARASFDTFVQTFRRP